MSLAEYLAQPDIYTHHTSTTRFSYYFVGDLEFEKLTEIATKRKGDVVIGFGTMVVCPGGALHISVGLIKIFFHFCQKKS